MVTQAEDKFNTGHSGGTAGGGGKTPESQTPSNTKPFFLLSELETSSINSANVFNSHHKGGRLTFINPHLSVDSTKYPDSDWNKPTQWVSPFEVVDSKKVEIIFPYSITSKQGGDFVIPEEMSNLSFSMSFEPIEDEDSQVTSSIYQASYADITIGNLRTYSGDVHRAKIFSKRQGQTSNAFTKVADFLLQPDNALVNTESVSGRQPIGFFFTQSIVDKYWESSSADVSVTTRDTYLVGGISLSGSNENEGASYTFKTKNNMVFEKREDYEVVFDLQYFKSDKSGSYGSSDDENPENISAAQSHAEIEVFLSGSIESENPDVEYSLGRLSSVPTDPDFTDLLSSESGSIRRVYNIFRTHGLENQISSGSLGFRISSGRFDISNISVSPFADQNFNPGFGKISIPMPLNDEAEVRYDFIAEFYDHNNNKSIQTAQTSASVLFNGPRKVISITGDDVWDGTATIGSSMLLHGSNPAFLASVGYKGFEKARAGAAGAADGGLLLFSGSIGSGADTNFLTASEAYDGVGIEIVDASAGSGNPGQHKFLRFRSKDPDNSGNASFRVQTDEFYFGQDRSVAGAQFVSGSEGNIEISSSNFHLDNDGSVVMQGSITATAGGQIGGFTITDKAISTTDFFLSGSTYSGTGFQNTNLVLSSSGFQINSDGEISASEGAIGGFGIGASSLSATGFFISGSSTGTGFADTNLFISSSGFQVNAVGAISASSGVIGGFGISKDSISDTAVTPKFFISGSPGATNNMADTNLFISASGFQVNSTGEISASAGVIGGFSIGSTLSSTNIVLNPAGPNIQLAGKTTFADNNVDGVYIGTEGIAIGDDNEFTVTNAGALTATDATISGNITATTGTIGGFTITGTELFSLDSGTPDSSPNNGITIDTTGGANSKPVIRVFDGAQENAALGNYASGKFGIKAIEGEIGGFQISGDSISSTNIFISGSPQAGGVHDTRYMFISTSKFNVKQDGDITGSAVLFEGGKVGGFTIDEDSIEGGNLVLHSAGRVESADFSSGVMAGSGQGFRLSAEGNGFLEVENARIRGTLSTAVFEKETVNAVGGIMMIGNSTVITGSGGFSGVTASSATMSVENVSGFTGSYNGFNSSGVVTNAEQIDGEILMIKKFDNTGFSTEYVCVQSASFNGDSTAQNNGTDLSGKLYVTRSFSGVAHDGVGSNQAKTGTGGFTGSYLPGGNAQNYEDGQVVVSTGKYFSGTAAGGDISGSGFIMLNAKSTDQFTPYIDIIERTGSFVYSMELKARLGDLSGLSSALVGSDPGFGLFSENVFLTGKITATSGEIAGWGLVGNKITSSNGSVELDSTGPGRISLGGTPPTDTTGDGAFLSGSGEFYVGKNNGERLHFNPTGNGLVVSSSNLSLDIGGLVIQGTDSADPTNNKILVGDATGLNSGGDGIFMDGDGKFRAGSATGHRLEFDEVNMVVSSSTFFLGSKGTNNTYISSSGNNLEISGSNFALTNGNITASNVDLSGKITATTGQIGGWTIHSDKIFTGTDENTANYTSTAGRLILSSSGALHAKEFYIDKDGNAAFKGDISAATGTIGNSIQIGSAESVFKADSNGIYLGNETFSSAEFRVNPEGDLTATSATITGNITATTGSFSGLLNVGNLANADDVGDTSTGFRVDANGNALIKQGGANADYIQFASESLNIKTSDTFILDAIDGNNKGIKIDSSIPSIIIQSGSGATQGKITLTSAPGAGVDNTTAAALVVSQSGQPIFSVGGEDFSFTSTQNLIVNSFPVEQEDALAPGDSAADFSIPATQNSFENSSDTNTNTAGGGAPTVKVANLLVASQMSASRFRAGKSLYLKNTADEASSRTTFNVSVLDQRASGSATNSPAVAGFDIKRNYDTFTVNDQIPQAVVFSSVISSSLDQGAASPKFVPNGAPSGSAIFHFQSLLREGSAGGPTFYDGKKCVVRIDSDVYQSGAPENEFVFIEGRAASGSYTTPTTIWQIQSDGHFVTRGNVTGFGANADFNTVSDKRFKKDVHTISGSMDKILQLRPTEFTWIEQEKQDVGFIAQEVEEIIPEIINTTRGMIEDEKETEEMKTISYPKFIPYLVDTIQQLTKRIEELEKNK